MKRNHALYATQENFAIAGDAERILVDGCQRKPIFGAVILNMHVLIVKNGEAWLVISSNLPLAADSCVS